MNCQKRKITAMLALILALLLCLSACSGKETPKAQEPTAGFTPKLDPKTEGSITVVGHYNNFEALEAEFNRFAEYYPNVKMQYTFLDNYNGIILTALNSSEAPDIFFTYPWMAYRDGYDAIYGELAENLADPALGIDLSCIRESLLYHTADQRVPTVPVYTTTFGMMVNEDLFAKEKIAVPTTYSQLVSACEALKKAGYASPVMAYNGSNFMLFPLYYPYFCSQISGNAEAIENLNTMKPGAGETMRSALQLVSDFMQKGFVDLGSCSQLENDYNAVIMRFFEGDIPIMFATGNTVSGTEKRESQSEAFTAHPFKYSFYPVPSTEEGGYFLNTVSMGFAVNKNSQNLDMANEFMRFLVSTEELNRICQAKRMVTPCVDMSLDAVYAAFGKIDAGRIINQSELGLADIPDTQVRRAAWQVTNGQMTVDEAVEAFGTLE
ncbi:MAG: carbohydrate ABC transporter substrate-binding protein [Clostridia bacterium]|nr:carbohydrate ABC transporter substrate-binding protein [Clostridia bacterium]